MNPLWERDYELLPYDGLFAEYLEMGMSSLEVQKTDNNNNCRPFTGNISLVHSSSQKTQAMFKCFHIMLGFI